MNLSADLYRIAELAHKGVDDDYIRDECDEVAVRYTDKCLTGADVYRITERVYAENFESR
jgi:hypothetical protein